VPEPSKYTAYSSGHQGQMPDLDGYHANGIGATAADPADLHRLAVQAYQRGDWAAARSALNKAIALDPRCPAYHNDLGLVLMAENQYHAALTCFSMVRIAARRSMSSIPLTYKISRGGDSLPYPNPVTPERCVFGTGVCISSAGRPRIAGHPKRITGACLSTKVSQMRIDGAKKSRSLPPECIMEVPLYITPSLFLAASKATISRFQAIHTTPA